MLVQCRICETRKPRRHCPGVRGDICAQCCGAEREVTIHCPLDCEYLSQAREHDRMIQLDPSTIPNKDIRVSEEFLQTNDRLLAFCSYSLLAAAMATPDAVDRDVRDALEAIIKTYRTRQSGLIYESRPSNLIAGAIQQRLQTSIDDMLKKVQEQTGMNTIRDADILGVLVFLQRFEMQWTNGRPLGRAFISYLLAQYPPRQSDSLISA